MADLAGKPDFKSKDSSLNGRDEVAKHDEHIDLPKGDLANNVNARIVNPLAGKSEQELRAEVAQFCATYGFQDDEEVFQKGALVAQNPSAFEGLECLDQEDLRTLRREITHRWHHPKTLYATVAVLSLGCAVQGWDNTGTNGANLTYPVEFGIADRQLLVGFVNSSLTISGAVFTWSNDFWNHYLGRRGVVFLTGLFCIFPILGQAFTHTWQEMVIIRLITGAALGVKIATIPIYSSEIAPANIRGGLTMQFQTWVAFGILAGFCFSTERVGDAAWRYQIAAAFAPAVPVCLLCWFCPESPRWLLKKGRHQKAFRSFCRLRNTKLQAARDLYYSWTQIQEEQKAFGGSTYFGRIADLFRVPRIRRASYATFAVMLAQQLSGINIMAFYSSTIFVDAGWNEERALWASFGFSVVVFVVVPIAWYTIDTFGRRSLLLFGFPLMGLSLFIVGGLYSLPESTGARLPLIAVFIYIFSGLYGTCMGPVPNVVASESFPLSHRETGGAWGIFINNSFSTALGLTFPLLLARVGGTNAFIFYGSLNILALIVVFFLLPETKQRTLEELDYIFAVPTTKFAAYQSGTWLPGMIKRHIFRQKVDVPRLYNLDEVAGGTYYQAVGH